MEARTVELAAGDAFVVRKGVGHDPVADQECQIMLIEGRTTPHTGGEVAGRTRSLADRLRSL